MVAAAVGIGSAVAGVAGSAINSGAAGSAAKSAQQATNAGIQAQEQENNQTIFNEQPFLNNGYVAIGNAEDIYKSNAAALQPYQNALAPGGITEATLENTPGYKFNLQQGLQSTQNAAAARGLGVSGAALKGAATYATGLADSTYQNQYNDALNAYNSTGNQLNTLFGQNQQIANLGGNVAVQQGTTNAALGTGVSNSLASNATAQGAASIASGNALSSGVNSIANAASGYQTNQLLQNYLNNNGSQYGTPGLGSGAAIPSGQAYDPTTDSGIYRV